MPDSLYAGLYVAVPDAHEGATGALQAIAHDFSPRYECHRTANGELVLIDVSGLERLLGPAQLIGQELRRATGSQGVRAHVAVAGTHTAARMLAYGRPGLTVSARGAESDVLASFPIGVLETVPTFDIPVAVFRSWGLKTLGEFAALPGAELVARFGRQALEWQALARGEDLRPLVPTLEEERFEATLELEWPIDGLEPLSFVLTRLLEPLSTRLERRDRGTAVLHVLLGLVTRECFMRRLELPAPMRDVRALRTLALLDLESHPPAAAIDRVTIVIDPTPARVLQHRLFARAHPTPEQLSTLLARLGALMGQDRIGAPATVDTYRPGAFVMNAFAIGLDTREYTDARAADAGSRGEGRPVLDTREHGDARAAGAGSRRQGRPVLDTREHGDARAAGAGSRGEGRPVLDTREHYGASASARGGGAPREVEVAASLLHSALRRCRHPVPARVAVVDGRPVRVTTDRRGFAGGAVLHCAGPWRTSGDWWATNAAHVASGGARRSGVDLCEGDSASASGAGGAASAKAAAGPPEPDKFLRAEAGGPRANKYWHRDEWDVALSDGAVYRVFRDRDTGGWFIDAIFD